MLGGGLERGTTVLLMGQAGTGKTTLSAVYAFQAVERGERAAIYLFDQTQSIYLRQLQGAKINLSRGIEAGQIRVQQINPAEVTPGEFAWRIRREVEAGARTVVIDSLNGY